MIEIEDKRKPVNIEKYGEQGFILCDEKKAVSVKFIEVIGKGGSALVYRGKLSTGRGCVVKEWYPSEQEFGYDYEYYRNPDTDEIEIIPREKNINQKKFDLIRQYEIERQQRCVSQEIAVTEKMFSIDGVHNNNYSFEVEFQCRKGDSTYIILRTTDGMTLYQKLLKQKDQKFSVEQAIRYTKKMLGIIEVMFDGERKYCHGDIKPENIWVGTQSDNEDIEHLYLLDFGSVFAYDDYQCKDYLEWTDEQILEKADTILDNEGIACSSKNYCSEQLLNLKDSKEVYLGERSVENAKRLLKYMNEMSINTDIYSVIQIFYRMLSGEDYIGIYAEDLAEKINLSGDLAEIIAENILEIIRKNRAGRYNSICEAREDLEALQKLLNREADPKVLLWGVLRDIEENEFETPDERLFGKIWE